MQMIHHIVSSVYQLQNSLLFEILNRKHKLKERKKKRKRRVEEI